MSIIDTAERAYRAAVAEEARLHQELAKIEATLPNLKSCMGLVQDCLTLEGADFYRHFDDQLRAFITGSMANGGWPDAVIRDGFVSSECLHALLHAQLLDLYGTRLTALGVTKTGPSIEQRQQHIEALKKAILQAESDRADALREWRKLADNPQDLPT